jgi:L-amino acid N-acyltransferase YncA
MTVGTVDASFSRSAIVAGRLKDWLETIERSLPILISIKSDVVDQAMKGPLASAHFYPVEQIFHLENQLDLLKLPSNEDKGESLRTRFAMLDDLNQLTRIASSAFENDRFHLDPHVVNSRADDRMRNWVEDGLRTGDIVIGVEHASGGKLLGFVQCRLLSKSTGWLALIAADPEVNGVAVIDSLFRRAVEVLRERGVTRLSATVSGNNLGSFNLAIRQGFELIGMSETWHWYGAPRQ